jgi:hypothetical protein
VQKFDAGFAQHVGQLRYLSVRADGRLSAGPNGAGAQKRKKDDAGQYFS